VTAFTDGDPGLRAVLVDAGITKPPILDWFHIAMRLQHAAQSAGALATDDPARAKAKARIVAEVERLRWRSWNGPRMPGVVSIGSARSCMSTAANVATMPGARHRAGCGTVPSVFTPDRNSRGGSVRA
jgi:hypothetical protein